MNRYLLSDQRVTKSKLTYIKDCIVIELSLLKNDIPYFDGGISEVTELKESTVQDTISDVVKELIARLNATTDSNIQLKSIDMYRDQVNIQFLIDGVEVDYEIKR